MTDESSVYPPIAKDFGGHGQVNHSAEEYVRAMFWHTNTAENYFSILKRGIVGIYHHVSETHLHRYLAEFDFRYNQRISLGVNDDQRMAKATQGRCRQAANLSADSWGRRNPEAEIPF